MGSIGGGTFPHSCVGMHARCGACAHTAHERDTRRGRRLALAAALFLCSSAGAQTHLFVDDADIARKENVVRRAHACEKLPEPVLEPEAPWERDGIDERVYIYGTVLRDPGTGLFRMWYNRLDLVLYATSQDGLHWERPRLGLQEFNGSKENNIVYPGLHSPSVVYNPEAEPDYRYTLLGYTRKPVRGCYALHSPDGIHWTMYPENPVVVGGDTCTLTRDPATGRYFVYAKRSEKHRGPERRLVYAASSPDMQHFGEPVLAMAPDATDDAQVRAQGGQCAEFYNMAVFPCGGLFLGFATLFHYVGAPERKGPAQSGDDGPIDVRLAYSRDGLEWKRCEDRSPVIPNGPHAYDRGCILGVSTAPVFVDDEVWLYYTAITTTHGGFLPEKRITIALAKWRRDGFVSLDAGGEPGVVETVPRNLANKRLTVNADAANGALTVAVLGADGAPVPGYGHGDCVPLESDSVRHTVRWKEHETLPDSNGLRLQFRFKNARLYSFTAAPVS